MGFQILVRHNIINSIFQILLRHNIINGIFQILVRHNIINDIFNRKLITNLTKLTSIHLLKILFSFSRNINTIYSCRLLYIFIEL